MSALTSIFFMGSSTAIRISSGLLSFAFLARVLGPEGFGQFMLWFSIATLIGLAANYGLTPYMLRELTVQKERASKLIGDVLTAKLILSILLICIVLPCSLLIDSAFRLVFISLFFAILFDSLTEFFNTGYRTTNRFASETKIATAASILQLLFTVIIVYYYPTVLAASLATLSSRIFVSLITWRDQSQYLNGINLGSIKSGITQLQKASSYAVDFVLQSLMGQVDSIIISNMIGVSAVGIYQAGMRIFLGCAQAANVLANVFIPRLSIVTNNHLSNIQTTNNQEIKYVQFSFIGVGIVLGLIMATGANLITELIFGIEFSELAALFPLFGLLFFVRFFAASQGVILTSAGLQLFRTYANLALWIVVLIAAFLLVPSMGLKGWLFALIIGNAFLGLVYLIRVSVRFELNMQSIALSSLGLLFFIPFVSGK